MLHSETKLDQFINKSLLCPNAAFKSSREVSMCVRLEIGENNMDTLDYLKFLSLF